MNDPAAKAPSVKTLGIRLPDELHAQFVMVAQLDGVSLTDAIRRAIEAYVAGKQSEPDFRARVAAALEEIEREASGRRSAIQALIGTRSQAAGAPAGKVASRSSGSKGSSAPR